VQLLASNAHCPNHLNWFSYTFFLIGSSVEFLTRHCSFLVLSLKTLPITIDLRFSAFSFLLQLFVLWTCSFLSTQHSKLTKHCWSYICPSNIISPLISQIHYFSWLRHKHIWRNICVLRNFTIRSSHWLQNEWWLGAVWFRISKRI